MKQWLASKFKPSFFMRSFFNGVSIKQNIQLNINELGKNKWQLLIYIYIYIYMQIENRYFFKKLPTKTYLHLDQLPLIHFMKEQTKCAYTLMPTHRAIQIEQHTHIHTHTHTHTHTHIYIFFLIYIYIYSFGSFFCCCWMAY